MTERRDRAKGVVSGSEETEVVRGTHATVPDDRNDDVVIYVNGEWLRREEAVISVYDSAFLVGDGVWEGMRIHDGAYGHLDRHLDRLFATADAVGLDIGMDRSEITELLHEVARRNQMTDDAHVRLMITRGTKKTPSQDPRLVVGGPNIVVIAEHKVADPTVAAEGISLQTSSVRRPPPDSLDQRWNCHSKLHEVVALIEALDAGADEALMLDQSGNVATCNATNFFIIRDGEVWTSTGEHCLNGITRGLVIELAREAGRVAHEADFTLDDVYAADESFVTGTFGALTPVVSVDGRTIGSGQPGPVTSELGRIYRRALGENDR
jgi:branched-chain amino acid aminotransferase